LKIDDLCPAFYWRDSLCLYGWKGEVVLNSKRSAIKDILFGVSVVSILLLSLVPAGCDSDTGAVAYNISPRDAAIAKAEA